MFHGGSEKEFAFAAPPNARYSLRKLDALRPTKQKKNLLLSPGGFPFPIITASITESNLDSTVFLPPKDERTAMSTAAAFLPLEHFRPSDITRKNGVCAAISSRQAGLSNSFDAETRPR